jgi:hypothetical protein
MLCSGYQSQCISSLFLLKNKVLLLISIYDFVFLIEKKKVIKEINYCQFILFVLNFFFWKLSNNFEHTFQYTVVYGLLIKSKAFYRIFTELFYRISGQKYTLHELYVEFNFFLSQSFKLWIKNYQRISF